MLKKILLFVLIIVSLSSNMYSQKEDILWQKGLLFNKVIEFSPFENSVAFASRTYVQFFDNETGMEIRSLQIGGDEDYIYDLCYSRDGKYLVVGIRFKSFTNNTIHKLSIWDTENYELITVKELQGYSDLSLPVEMVFSPDDKLLAIATVHSGLRFYETTNWEEIQIWNDFSIVAETGENASVDYVSFRKDGKVIAISSKQIYQVVLYNLETNEIIKTIENANKAIYSPTRNELLVKKVFEEYDTYYTEGLDLYNFDLSEL